MSMNSASSENATISSRRSAIRRSDMPWIVPFMNTFSRPVKSGWKPAPSSSIEATLPPISTRPEWGGRIPANSFRSVLLPEPFSPTTPSASPGATSRSTSRRAQSSV